MGRRRWRDGRAKLALRSLITPQQGIDGVAGTLSMLWEARIYTCVRKCPRFYPTGRLRDRFFTRSHTCIHESCKYIRHSNPLRLAEHLFSPFARPGVPGVWLVGRDAAKLSAAQDQLAALGSVRTSTVDLRDVDAVDTLIQDIHETDAHVRYLVNAAGTFFPKSFLEHRGDDYDA